MSISPTNQVELGRSKAIILMILEKAGVTFQGRIVSTEALFGK